MKTPLVSFLILYAISYTKAINLRGLISATRVYEQMEYNSYHTENKHREPSNSPYKSNND